MAGENGYDIHAFCNVNNLRTVVRKPYELEAADKKLTASRELCSASAGAT